MKMKNCYALMLVLAIVMGNIAGAELSNTPLSYSLGAQIQDFTFTTYDGHEISLYDVLQEKDVVMINIWATWCGPCRSEFPYMEEAYRQYQDDIEIFALSSESNDTNTVLAKFASQMGLTFKIGQDPVGFLYALGMNSIPTTLMVDRFGTICFIASGAQPDTSAFIRLFDAFVGDDYTESVLYKQLPPRRPDVQPSAEAELAQALNGDGGHIVFTNDTGKYSWPMLAAEKDGRCVAVSSNQGVMPSTAVVNATVSAEADDVLAVTFKISSEAAYDLMQLRVNGVVVKSFGGEKDWMTYAYAFPADGEYEIAITYTKDDMTSAGQDTLWIDSVVLLSGDDAKQALAGNPTYPFGDEVAIHVESAATREIVFTDPTGMIAGYYGDGPFYLIPEDQASFIFTVTPEYDPEAVVISFNFDGSTYALSNCIADGQYRAVGGIDSVKTTGYCDSTVYLSTDPDDIRSGKRITYFKDESNIEAFLKSLTSDRNGNVLGTWSYAASELPVRAGNHEASTEAAFTFRCVDQNGDPVAGAMIQVCDDETCQVLISDAAGMCSFTGAPYKWEVHVLKAPSGYTSDSDAIIYTPAEGGELVFSFTKN